MAESSYPVSKAKGGGREEPPHVRGQGQRLKPGEVAGRSKPTSKEWWLPGRRMAERSYSTFKVRRGSGEEIPLIQGKEQWLCFAGATLKRYPMPKVRETQIRR